MSQALRVLVAGACLALAGCGSSSDATIEPGKVVNAFAASGLQLQRSPVPASADGLDYVHFPIGGSANDLVVTVFGTEQAAGSYEQASRGGLPAAVKVKAVERVRNVVLVINDAASASTERAARDALARLS